MGRNALLCTLTLLVSIPVFAQRERLALPGHLHPLAQPDNDRGRMDSATQLKHLAVILKPNAAQQTELEALLAAQQDSSSPEFHKWLTPEEYGARFGAAQADIDNLKVWLESQNLTVLSTSRARDSVAFSGSAGDIEKAFSTELHEFSVNGETHFANISNPVLPAGLTHMAASVRGLHNFRMRPKWKPRYTSVTTGSHYLAPDDLAAIYNIRPLYSAGIDGTGQKIAVVGQTQLPLSDIRQFRTYFNLPPKDPQITLVPNTKDPGVTDGDLEEADLDVEWAGAVARNASINYVYSDDVEVSLFYAIDQNLAPVISMSYGLCETDSDPADLTNLSAYAKKANALGITWLTASGDSGANDCYASNPRATGVLTVDAPASIPEVTGVGGTTLAEGSGNFWSSNDANHASALSYIPEGVWNDSVADGQPSSSGGGVSSVFAKPSWQSGSGVFSDTFRSVPDISLSASANHDSYLVYTGGQFIPIGGTSAGAPSFAGVVALLNHYLVANGLQQAAGTGNINPRLYAMAQSVPSAFHDIVNGDNVVQACPSRSRTCTAANIGYKAGVGYDPATGLGSVDAYTLVTNWKTGLSARAVAPLSVRVASLPDGSMTFTALLNPTDGGTPTGRVAFSVGGVALASVTLPANSLTVTPAQLAGGNVLTADYSGNYPSVSASVSLVTISGITSAASFRQSYAPGMIATVFGTQLASGVQIAPGLPLPTLLGGTSATINGIPAPLYYVSGGQVNLQVPDSISPGAQAVLKITSNGQSATTFFTLATAAPGIFLDATGALPGYASAGRGQTIAMYVTGDGGVKSPVVSVGGVSGTIAYDGVPSWSVGVRQINFTVPVNAPLGPQSVTVRLGGVTSAPAILNVTP